MTAGPVLTTAIRYRAIVRAALLGALAWVTGCSSILVLDTSKESASILQPLQASSDVVTVDIYWATIPTDSTAEDEQLWRFVQEDRLDHTLRARLHQNGLRAGVVGGAPPAEIVRMLNPNGETTDTESSEFRSPLVAPTGVSRSTQQLRPGKAATIHASDILTEAPILLSESGQLRGEIYHDVQPVYSLKLERQESGGYNVVLTPELHHGQQRMRWSADETGMMTLGSATREKEIFADLRIEAPLVVGEMLVATSRPGPESCLGHYFHQTEAEATGSRKAILVRLTRAPQSPLFEE